MYLLDTNVLSELMRGLPERRVIEWLDSRDASDLWISAITAAELRVGVARLPEGARKTDLNQRIERALGVEFAGW
jgi:toxin FitB